MLDGCLGGWRGSEAAGCLAAPPHRTWGLNARSAVAAHNSTWHPSDFCTLRPSGCTSCR